MNAQDAADRSRYAVLGGLRGRNQHSDVSVRSGTRGNSGDCACRSIRMPDSGSGTLEPDGGSVEGSDPSAKVNAKGCSVLCGGVHR